MKRSQDKNKEIDVSKMSDKEKEDLLQSSLMRAWRAAKKPKLAPVRCEATEMMERVIWKTKEGV